MYTNLDDLRSSPLFKVAMVSGVRCDDVRPVLSASHRFYANSGLYTPEVSATRFYLLNHLVAELETQKHPYEPLTPEESDLVTAYHKEVHLTGRAIFTYLLLICTRESRHAHNNEYVKALKDSDERFFNFVTSIKGTGSTNAVCKFMDARDSYPLPMSLETYVEALRDLFTLGSFSSSYGGKAWAEITEVLLAYVSGGISLEMLVDQAFHLAHNNGAIFNKGMVFEMYCEDLAMILDVQRSGQVPNLCVNPLHEATKDYYLRASIRSGLTSLISKHIPTGKYPPVDWLKVSALGGKHNYKKYLNTDQLAELPQEVNTNKPKPKPTKVEEAHPITIHAGLTLNLILKDRITGSRI